MSCYEENQLHPRETQHIFIYLFPIARDIREILIHMKFQFLF